MSTPSRIIRIVTITLALATASCLAGCYTKTISRTPAFGERTDSIEEPDAPDNFIEDAADLIYPRDWKKKHPDD